MGFCKDIYNMISLKHPDSNIYLISDEHFYHRNILDYTRGEFTSVEDMNNYIISSHNSVVQNDDVVIILGDFCFKNASIKELIAKLNGHKYLVLGNHDPDIIVKNYPSLGLDGVFTTPVRLDGTYLSHEPLAPGEKDTCGFKMAITEFRKLADAHNYHGHIHTEERLEEDRYTNVTCEALSYKPLLVGRTKSNAIKPAPYFINSPLFGKSVSLISEKFKINPRFLLKDYVYTTILSYLGNYMGDFFVQGSFGLYKKYGFASDFSDIDISFLYNEGISKKRNVDKMKQMVDHVYFGLMDIDGVNEEFIKRYSSLRIFEILLTTDNPYFTKCYMDSNLIFLDSYKETDYSLRCGRSTLERLLNRESSLDVSGYVFPEYQSNFLNFYGDVANLILQLLFEDANSQKRALMTRKLMYILKMNSDRIDMKEFEDTLTRFFLRNVSLLNTLRRYDEIGYIQNMFEDFDGYFYKLPRAVADKVFQLISSNDSQFMDAYGRISEIPAKDVVDKSRELMLEYRSR